MNALIQKLFGKWIARRALNALFMYHAHHCPNARSEKSDKVIDVLDYIRKDL